MLNPAAIPTPYEDLLRKIMAEGVDRGDRTGTGTRSLFGQQLRYDLSAGFPLLTTKKMFTRGAIEELLWFISGDTNEHTLRDKNVNIWREWAREDGSLGPVYGKQFRHVSSFVTVKPELFSPADTSCELPALVREGRVRNLNARNTYGVGYCGDYDPDDPHYEWLVNVWRQMVRRCYDPTCKSYAGYGAKGVHVSEQWQCFATFQKDARKLPNWVMKLEYPDEFSLDKDMKSASNRYARETCSWVSNNVQHANLSNTKPFTVTDPDGNNVAVSSIGRLAREEGMNLSAIHRCLNGKLKSHHGWTNFAYIEAPEGEVVRYNEVDQLKYVVASLKHDPESRRHIISLWNPSEVDMMELPPCHGNIIQFYVASGKLSCAMYQRSCDMFLGVPVNIASYALLTHMMAAQAGLGVGEFIWTGGDTHIYHNHFDQVAEQLSREPRPYPTLELAPRDSLFDYQLEDFTFHNYAPHPAIKAPVAV